jgi:hypothetical protein
MSERRFEITPRGNTSEPSLSTTKLLSAVSPFAHETLRNNRAIGPDGIIYSCQGSVSLATRSDKILG